MTAPSPPPTSPSPARSGPAVPPRGPVSLDEACAFTRTGDIWVFRGRSLADRAIRGLTNAPVNHVGMALVLDDLPPLMWHAELGRGLPDVWAGRHQRGVQLHDLRAAVLQWGHRYRQRAWLRQLTGPVGREHEDAALRMVARLDGTPFPSTARLAGRWLTGRVSRLRPTSWRPASWRPVHWATESIPDTSPLAGELPDVDTAYCAEVVALTYQEMGLLPAGRRPSWYDPGRFWSGDDTRLTSGFALGGEIAVTLPAPETAPPDDQDR